MRQTYLTMLLSVLMSMVGAKASAKITVENADGVTIYYNLINNKTAMEVTYPDNPYTYTGNIAIPELVTYEGKTYKVTLIGSRAFEGCSGVTSVTIPNSVTLISHDAFRDCSGLTGELIIPNSVTTIDESAFRNCSGLTSIVIPNSVTSIYIEAFQGCTSLASVISLGTTPPTIRNRGEYDVFSTITYQNATLHVPAGCKEAYQQANYWKNFWNIQDDASTDIKSINADKQVKNMIYTLDGVKLNTTNVSDLTNGIYIVNGKKVVVK